MEKIFKVRIIVFFVAVFVSFGLHSTVYAEIIPQDNIYEFTFSQQDLIFEKLNDYDRVTFPDSIPLRTVGAPELPYKVIHFAIPQGTRISHIEILEDVTEEIPGFYNIYPAQKTQKYTEIAQFTPPDLNAYNLRKYFPAHIIGESVEGSLSGLSISSWRLYPLQYLPAERKLLLHKNITLRLNFINTDKVLSDISVNHAKRTPRARRIIKRFVEKIVANPQEVDALLSGSLASIPADDSLLKAPDGHDENTRDDSVDYLIVTSDEFIASGVFNPLLVSRAFKGLTTRIEAISWIETNYTGRDTQEKIRNFIKDLYANNGLIYVLLGGDTNIVPARSGVVFCDQWECPPTDMYYSDLDGTWDDEYGDGIGDDNFGEPEDNVDLYPDVFVGRAPVEDEAEAAIFVNKTITFESKTFADYGDNKALFIGCDDFEDSGGRVKDLISLLYMPNVFDPIKKLYQRDLTENVSSVFSALNDGHYIVNHIDHGDVDKLWTAGEYIGMNNDPEAGRLIEDLNNAPYFSVIWSVACFPAAIDMDCIAEHWINNPNGGGVAFIGNSRDGLNPQSDHMLDPEFYKSLFQENINTLGQTLADSKIPFISEARLDDPIRGEPMRYAMYELNLLGDPALELYFGQSGLVFEVPQDYPTIQEAINAASYGDTIKVAPGTYTENINFLGKDITLKSTHDPEVTIIDGNGAGSVVTFNSGESSNSVLEGFTIRNGLAEWGGGIYCNNESAPLIRNNIITANTATYGGGVAAKGQSFLTMTHNIISGNTAQAAGGILILESKSVITNNSITNNTTTDWDGGGITYYDSYSYGMSNNIIAGNSAATYGGGISCVSSWLETTNNTIVGNTANSSGGGFYSAQSDSSIINSIVWGNDATQSPQIYHDGGGEVIQYSDIQGGRPGLGNVDVDPLFVNPAEENFYLQEGSPCVDAGDFNSDYSREPEPNGDRINIGAYGNTPVATVSLLCGDLIGDWSVDIGDFIYMVDWMFNNGPEPSSWWAANVDGVDSVDIGDLIYMIDYYFNNGPELQCAPISEPGRDKSGVGLPQTLEELQDYMKGMCETSGIENNLLCPDSGGVKPGTGGLKK